MEKKQHNSLIKKAISSLYEVENFLEKYTTFSDAASVLKIIKHQNTKPPH